MTTFLQVVGGILLLALVVVLWNLQRRGQADHGRVVQLHHGYMGAVMMILAPFLLAFSPAPTWVLILVVLIQLLGFWWLADDLYQHVRQFPEPMYRSPWHRWAHDWGVI